MKGNEDDILHRFWHDEEFDELIGVLESLPQLDEAFFHEQMAFANRVTVDVMEGRDIVLIHEFAWICEHFYDQRCLRIFRCCLDPSAW